MSDAIPDSPAYNTPPDYTAGLDFNYEGRWVPGTTVTLANVPWDSDYRDVVSFDNHGQLNNYLDNKGTQNLEIEKLSWAKPGMPIKLPISVNRINRFNYLRVVNPIQNDGGNTADFEQYYYYFITSAEWGSPNSTIVTVQLDVWATYSVMAEWGNAFVEQGHIGIANERQFEDYGRTFLSIPEGLDAGGEYQTVEVRSRNVFTQFQESSSYPFPERDGFMILVCTTVSLTGDPGDANKPKLNSASGDFFQGMPSGAEYYIFQTAAKFSDFMSAYADKPWITQGIISITVIPKAERYGYELQPIDMSFSDDDRVRQVEMFKLKDFFGFARLWPMAPNWRTDDDFTRHIPARYRHLKKFFTSPYMMIELTTFTGTPVLLKPESWNNPNADINEKAALVPPNQRILFMPVSYNARNGAVVDRIFGGGKSDIYDDKGDYLDMACQITNFPSLALVNNGAIGFMASTRNAIAYQHTSADWSQQRAMMGATTGAGQATQSIEATNAQGTIARRTANNQLNVQQNAAWESAGVGALGSMAGGAMSGNMMGVAGGATSAASGLAQTGISTTAAALSTGVSNSASLDSQQVVTNQMAYNRDTNLKLASSVAQGDYGQALAAINAKIQDAQLTQPSVSGQVGGEAFGIIHSASRFSVRWKTLHPAAMRMIGDMWLRFGYKVMQFTKLPNNLMVMDRFTYWKVSETNVFGPITETNKRVLRGIVEKGVTVWANADDIGRIDWADNRPMTGIRL